MFCSQCGKKLPDDAKFCMFCGTKVIADDQETESEVPPSLPTKTESTKLEDKKCQNDEAVKTFNLLGTSINFTKKWDTYMNIRAPFSEASFVESTNFKSEYDDEIQCYEDIEEKALELLTNYLNRSIEEGVEYLVALNIHDFDNNRLYHLCESDFQDDYDTYIEPIIDGLNKVADREQKIDTIRKIQRAGRSGSWVGGGFGISGALKGALMAGALNAGANILHGIGDAATDASDRENITNIKKEIFDKADICGQFEECVSNAYFHIFNVIIKIMCVNKLGGLEKDDIEYFNSVVNSNALRSRKNILNSQFGNKEISIEDYKKQLLQLLQLNPADVEIYLRLYDYFINTEETYKECISLAEYVGYKNMVSVYSVSVDIEKLEDMINSCTDKESDIEQCLNALRQQKIINPNLVEYDKESLAEYENGLLLRLKSRDKNYGYGWEKKLIEFAQHGDVESQFTLGYSYFNGDKVEQDFVEAFKWYLMAAKQGNARSQHAIAYQYFTGSGVGKDEKCAFQWFSEAAEQGLDSSQQTLGLLYSEGRGVLKNDIESVNWYTKAAEQGNASAQYSLGYMYLSGTGGVTQNLSKAINLLTQSAEKGNAKAQHVIGFCYLKGLGVVANREEATKWLQLAANQGITGAQELLSGM